MGDVVDWSSAANQPQSLIEPWLTPGWNPNPLVPIGATGPVDYVRTAAIASGVPPLLARPPEAAPAPTPWLLLAGLGLVAYMVMR
jgi:hypothetical protein